MSRSFTREWWEPRNEPVPHWWFLLAMLTTILLGLGCRDIKYPPRQQARSAVIVTAESIRVFSVICARYIVIEGETDREKALDLGNTCKDGYDSARLALIGTADAVDKWDSSQTTRDSIVCSVKHALDALEPSLVKLRQRNVTVAVVDDARQILVALGPCHEVIP